MLARLPRIGQFRLCTLLAAVGVAAVACALAAAKLHSERRRTAAIELLKANALVSFHDPRRDTPKWLEWLGAGELFTRVRSVRIMDYGPSDPRSLFAALDDIPELEELSVFVRPTTEEDFRHIGACSALRRLLLNGRTDVAGMGDVPDDAWSYLGALMNLETLQIHGNMVSDAALRPIGKLHRLKYLLLHTTSVGDDGLQFIAAHSDLEYLDLSNRRITDVGVCHLRSLMHLRAPNKITKTECSDRQGRRPVS
jgi:hypothetical protein